jgi:hypothetical protein
MRLAIGAGGIVDFKGKVVRSYVHGFDKNERGETVVKYRAAVQFQTVPAEHETKLQQFIQGMGDTDLRADLRANP